MPNTNQANFFDGSRLLFRYAVICVFLLAASQISAQPVKRDKVLYKDDFEKSLNTKTWKVEMVPGPTASVSTKNGKLIIDSPGGVSVWLNQKLSGNISIEYDWKVIADGGKNDRLSDLNQFWMAVDPKNANLFTRNGVFEAYDSLRLYYVGMGGNANTTTRFRKYHGNGKRQLLKEYTDKEHLLKPNQTYHIKILVLNGQTSFWVDGERYFEYNDENPLTEGYFGFRSTWSRHEIDHFQVSRIKSE
ncbi:DUF6250 domain-containing protein [Dyadobacter psychrotolerans]|uniref:Methyltransferase n=1 Tax=Dyadobacter psychrotolerans TaxID=2541721 RepID=A0A4V2Z3J2_9BACT|nr:DUF6250 domain-containing protein [Dyadobacter psychrotolerans]TDE12818.1 methyltransferase [Dyadobacter psychrotolerans]